ncbi:MAG TPA: LysR substrate-binding domain-containing protein [Dokdonella sp.]|nr:LysR substrate-binding domain-containing protein [Dokdonella sp.]
MPTPSLRQLNYRHLHYFWAVAKEGHLTRVATKLHVSQSALSAQIRLLEEQLGQALFEREGRRLVLSETGQLVLGFAEGIFALGNELVEAVSAGQAQAVQRLRVGGVATLSRNFQENFLRPVVGLDGVHLVHESGSLEELLERLRVHKLDLVLSNSAVATEIDRPWRCRRLARQPVCLVGHPRPRGKPFRFPRDLADARLLLPGIGSDLRAQFDVLCEDLGVRYTLFAEVDDMAMLRLLARDSGGVALLPEVVVQDELRNGILEAYCTVPKVHENFYAITTARRRQPSILKQLLERGMPARPAAGTVRKRGAAR